MRRSQGMWLEDPKERIKCEINRMRDIVNQTKIYKFINSPDLLYCLKLASMIYNLASWWYWNHSTKLTIDRYFARIHFRRDSPKLIFHALRPAIICHRQVTLVIGLSSTSPFDAWIIDRSSTIVYGICSQIFLVVRTDWVSNSW